MISLPRICSAAQPAALHRLRAGGQRALQHLHPGMDRQVAEVAGVPQHHGLDHVAVHVGLVDVGQRQADHVDVLARRLAHRLGGAGHRRRRDRHHQLRVRMHAQDRLCLGERLVAVVVGRPDRRQRQARMLLRDALLDERDPLVLVGRAERAGEDRELALAVEQARRFVGQRVADAFRRRLVDEEVARVRLGVGVPRQHLDAALPRLAQHGRDPGAVLHRHRDDVDAAGDPVLDHLVLPGRVEAGRAVPDQLDAELLRGLLRADAAADEVRDRPSPSASSRSPAAPSAPARARRLPRRATPAACRASDRTSHTLVLATISDPAMTAAHSTAT